MKAQIDKIIRLLLIIRKLSGHQKYTDSHDLQRYITDRMRERNFKVSKLSDRTIQRDILKIKDIFGISIKCSRGRGYFIEEQEEAMLVKYDEMLQNFDLLTAVGSDSNIHQYIQADHHRAVGNDCMPSLIAAIKDRRVVEFDYVLYRKDGKLIHKKVKPYFLKESLGFWYLMALDEEESLKSYGVDRIKNLELTEEKFKRDESVNLKDRFKYSYGIWDAPDKPVETVELSYSPLDGYFLKAFPLHSTQEILVDNEDEFRITLRIRITKDFVMALLSRSMTLKVIAPESLKTQIREIYREALTRNQ